MDTIFVIQMAIKSTVSEELLLSANSLVMTSENHRSWPAMTIEKVLYKTAIHVGITFAMTIAKKIILKTNVVRKIGWNKVKTPSIAKFAYVKSIVIPPSASKFYLIVKGNAMAN